MLWLLPPAVGTPAVDAQNRPRKPKGRVFEAGCAARKEASRRLGSQASIVLRAAPRCPVPPQPQMPYQCARLLRDQSWSAIDSGPDGVFGKDRICGRTVRPFLSGLPFYVPFVS